MSPFILFLIVLSIASVALVVSLWWIVSPALRQSRKRFVVSLVLLGLSLPVLAALANLLQFNALDYDKQIARLEVSQLGAEAYRVRLTKNGEEFQDFDLYGDYWLLDVRMLVWESWLARLGVLPLYSFDRISGRYKSTEDELSKRRSVHSLRKSSPIDTWGLVSSLDLPFVAARYGNGTFMPLKDGVQYALYIGNRGVIAQEIVDTGIVEEGLGLKRPQ